MKDEKDFFLHWTVTTVHPCSSCFSSIFMERIMFTGNYMNMHGDLWWSWMKLGIWWCWTCRFLVWFRDQIHDTMRTTESPTRMSPMGSFNDVARMVWFWINTHMLREMKEMKWWRSSINIIKDPQVPAFPAIFSSVFERFWVIFCVGGSHWKSWISHGQPWSAKSWSRTEAVPSLPSLLTTAALQFSIQNLGRPAGQTGEMAWDMLGLFEPWVVGQYEIWWHDGWWMTWNLLGFLFLETWSWIGDIPPFQIMFGRCQRRSWSVRNFTLRFAEQGEEWLLQFAQVVKGWGDPSHIGCLWHPVASYGILSHPMASYGQYFRNLKVLQWKLAHIISHLLYTHNIS